MTRSAQLRALHRGLTELRMAARATASHRPKVVPSNDGSGERLGDTLNPHSIQV